MQKPKKCSFAGCDRPRMKQPGNTTLYFKYCEEHQIEYVLNKQREQKKKDKEDLEKARSEIKKKTPRQIFYSSTAWKWFSHYVLLFYADDDLTVSCCTSPTLRYKITDRNICVGHYQKVFDANSSNYSTAFEFKDVAPQSVYDNVHFGGKPEIMKIWIDKTHGEGTSKEMERLRKQSFKLDKYEYDRLAEHWKAKYKELLIQRQITDPWKK